LIADLYLFFGDVAIEGRSELQKRSPRRQHALVEVSGYPCLDLSEVDVPKAM